MKWEAASSYFEKKILFFWVVINYNGFKAKS